MTRKEIKNFAKKLAKLEIALREATDEKEIENIKNEIMKMSYKVASLDAMVEIDEEIQKILKKT